MKNNRIEPHGIFGGSAPKSGPWLAIILTIAIWLLTATIGKSSVDPQLACDNAAEQVSAQSGVPLAVLKAISLTETGRKREGQFRTWPWTVNMEGRGAWFETLDEAREYVRLNYDRGARSFDVGCFQLNYKWHGQAFSSIDQMFDPVSNATYAATFLQQLFDEMGNWPDAAGAYHSRTPKYANRYKARFKTILANLDVDLAAATPVARVASGTANGARNLIAQPRDNRFPLLQGGDQNRASLGSLMPLGIGAGLPRFIGIGS